MTAEKETKKEADVTKKKKERLEIPDLHRLFDKDFSTLFRFSASRQIGTKLGNFYDIGQSGVDTRLPPAGPNIAFTATVGPGRPSNYSESISEEHITIHEQEYQDYKSKTKFLGYYIPPSHYSYKIVEYLSDAYKKTMSDFELIGGLLVRYSAESSDLTDSRDLTFSGRVYIYHRDEFTLQELASLEQLYKSKGLSIIFRGTVYLQTTIDSEYK